MPTKIEERRSEERIRFPDFLGAEIEFEMPVGVTHICPMIELSMSGGSFPLDRRIDGLDTGASITNATIRVGELEVGAHLQVLRVSRGTKYPFVCGVQIFPATDLDRNELTGLLSRLDSMPV